MEFIVIVRKAAGFGEQFEVIEPPAVVDERRRSRLIGRAGSAIERHGDHGGAEHGTHDEGRGDADRRRPHRSRRSPQQQT